MEYLWRFRLKGSPWFHGGSPCRRLRFYGPASPEYLRSISGRPHVCAKHVIPLHVQATSCVGNSAKAISPRPKTQPGHVCRHKVDTKASRDSQNRSICFENSGRWFAWHTDLLSLTQPTLTNLLILCHIHSPTQLALTFSTRTFSLNLHSLCKKLGM